MISGSDFQSYLQLFIFENTTDVTNHSKFLLLTTKLQDSNKSGVTDNCFCLSGSSCHLALSPLLWYKFLWIETFHPSRVRTLKVLQQFKQIDASESSDIAIMHCDTHVSKVCLQRSETTSFVSASSQSAQCVPPTGVHVYQHYDTDDVASSAFMPMMRAQMRAHVRTDMSHMCARARTHFDTT